MTSFGVHGSEAQIELAPGLDPDQIDVQRRGWGTVLTFLNVRPISESGRSVWIHLAIPTPLSLEGVVLKVAKVRPVIDPSVANEMPAMHVWDGRRLIKAWETLAALSTTIEDGAWPVNLKLETGLGLSLKWALPVPIGENDSPAQFTIFGAWATFERLIEHTP